MRAREVEIINELLSFLGRGFEEKKPEVYNKLPFEQRQGNKGPFETVNEKTASNSDLYRHLFAKIKANNGRLSLGEYYYWLDTRDDAADPTAIFRRKKRG